MVGTKASAKRKDKQDRGSNNSNSGGGGGQRGRNDRAAAGRNNPCASERSERTVKVQCHHKLVKEARNKLNHVTNATEEDALAKIVGKMKDVATGRAEVEKHRDRKWQVHLNGNVVLFYTWSCDTYTVIGVSADDKQNKHHNYKIAGELVFAGYLRSNEWINLEK